MTPGDLARVADIRARADAATEGPWVRRGKWIDGGADGYDGVIEPDDVDCSSYCYGGSSRIEIADYDAEFIAAARSDVPWLLDRLAAETERADVAEAALARRPRRRVSAATDRMKGIDRG